MLYNKPRIAPTANAINLVLSGGGSSKAGTCHDGSPESASSVSAYEVDE
jgi:hypothetical protein